MKHTVYKEYRFSAAHWIRGHQGECARLHGHNYRVRVGVASETLDDLGMVIDFADLKRMLDEILSPFDHQVINEIPPFDVRNTTAELFAEFVAEELSARLAPAGLPREKSGEEGRDPIQNDRRRVWVVRVEVWESDSSCAIFEPRA